MRNDRKKIAVRKSEIPVAESFYLLLMLECELLIVIYKGLKMMKSKDRIETFRSTTSKIKRSV